MASGCSLLHTYYSTFDSTNTIFYCNCYECQEWRNKHKKDVVRFHNKKLRYENTLRKWAESEPKKWKIINHFKWSMNKPKWEDKYE